MFGNKLTVNVDRIELIETLKKNRQVHKSQYQDAITGFRIELEKELKQKLKNLKAGIAFELLWDNQKPENHITDYDDVIAMLEVSVDKTVQLDHEQFKQWFKDEWDWKRSWSARNSVYTVSAASSTN